MRHKIEQWKNKPEHERVKIVTRLTWGLGALFVFLWLAVLLPVQIHFSGRAEKEAEVQGITTEATPTPTPTPTSIFE